MIKYHISKWINLFSLLVCIFLVVILPFRKEVWYDETVSVLISKGIDHGTPSLFANVDSLSSPEITVLNTPANVFHATVIDNGNSFVYNLGLHWFTSLFGNSIGSYMFFSKLSSIGALLAFFVLCGLVFGESLFTTLALVLFTTDNIFIGMSHEVRAYSMGIFFVTLAAIYCYRFMYVREKPRYLLLLTLFSVCAILSHFLSVYEIALFFSALLIRKKSILFSRQNLLAIIAPLCLLVLFFAFAYSGLQNMNKQNDVFYKKQITLGFSYIEVLFRSLKFTAINFKVFFPAFKENRLVIMVSAITVIAGYFMGLRIARQKSEKRNLNLFFALGISGSIFLALLSFKSHHYTSLYYRYYSFCTPFTAIFVAYLCSIFMQNLAINKLLKIIVVCIALLPGLFLFSINFRNARPATDYNHIAVARAIVNEKATRIIVPKWDDALLLQSLLPAGYKIKYYRNPKATDFRFINERGEERVFFLKSGA